jgi:hypothetical protein
MCTGCRVMRTRAASSVNTSRIGPSVLEVIRAAVEPFRYAKQTNVTAQFCRQSAKGYDESNVGASHRIPNRRLCGIARVTTQHRCCGMDKRLRNSGALNR